MVTDALNRTKLLPYEYFSDWNLVQPWLERAFRGLPGESRVRDGEFALFAQRGGRTGSRILADDWERSVFPGDQIVMSMRTRRAQKAECQRCGRVFSSLLKAKTWSEW
jgi:hypothetical protein